MELPRLRWPRSLGRRPDAPFSIAARSGLEVEYELHAMNELLPRSLFAAEPLLFRMNEQGERAADANLFACIQRARSKSCPPTLSGWRASCAHHRPVLLLGRRRFAVVPVSALPRVHGIGPGARPREPPGAGAAPNRSRGPTGAPGLPQHAPRAPPSQSRAGCLPSNSPQSTAAMTSRITSRPGRTSATRWRHSRRICGCSDAQRAGPRVLAGRLRFSGWKRPAGWDPGAAERDRGGRRHLCAPGNPARHDVRGLDRRRRRTVRRFGEPTALAEYGAALRNR